jgi:hypothetical protein
VGVARARALGGAARHLVEGCERAPAGHAVAGAPAGGVVADGGRRLRGPRSRADAAAAGDRGGRGPAAAAGLHVLSAVRRPRSLGMGPRAVRPPRARARPAAYTPGRCRRRRGGDVDADHHRRAVRPRDSGRAAVAAASARRGPGDRRARDHAVRADALDRGAAAVHRARRHGGGPDGPAAGPAGGVLPRLHGGRPGAARPGPAGAPRDAVGHRRGDAPVQPVRGVQRRAAVLLRCAAGVGGLWASARAVDGARSCA